MSRHVEPLDRGLVTIRDPALLKPGELSFIRNAVYLPGSNALQRARGRSAFGTATASALDVSGLRDLKFDNGNHYLFAHVSASYVSAIVGDTGTFGVVVSGIGVGTQLEAVQYRNRYFLFNGTTSSVTSIGTNRVAYLSATAAANTPLTRQHGLLPVFSAPPVVTSVGTFTQPVANATAYYEYWTTEVARVTNDGVPLVLESTFDTGAGPTTVLVSGATVVPTISMPAVRNPKITTHWRIYRSPVKSTATEKKFPSGFLIGEHSTATASASDSTATVATTYAFPTTYNTPGQVWANGTQANVSALGADDNASCTIVGGADLDSYGQACYTFGFTPFSGTIVGIEVSTEVYISNGSGNIPITITIYPNRNPADGGVAGDATATRNRWASKTLHTTDTTAPGTVYTVGGPTDRWFAANIPPLVDSEVNANFTVVLSAVLVNQTLSVDYVKVRFYHSASFDSVIPFPTVVYTFGDQTFQVGKNYPPPSSSTGALFQDTLVVNDVDNPSQIRWSSPGEPESFPPVYYLDFETRENDRVQFIGVVNNRLIVGLDSSLWRVNYLPSERDATFDRGNAVEAITRNYGIVNPMCACVFGTDGQQERLAFVSTQGIHATDGFNLETYSDGLDWRGDRDTVGIANTSTGNYVPQTLINDRERQELLFYFRNDAVGTGGRYFCLHFQYNELVDGKPRVSGMVTMENNNNLVGGANQRAVPKSAWAVPRNTGVTDVFIGYGTAANASASAFGAGMAYRETGTSIPSSYAGMVYQTRRLFLAGMGNEWKLNELYGYCGLVTWASAPGSATYEVNSRKTNGTSAATMSKTYTFATTAVGVPSELLHKVNFSQMCEGAAITATITGAGTYAQEYLILDGEDFGVEDSGL